MKNLNIQIEQWSVDRLAPSEGNPRTHSPEQVEQIAASIREFGFVNPILVGADTKIIAGEGRYRAALALGMRKVPVIKLEHLSEVQRRALAIADNQLALNAGWDEQMLRHQLAALKDADFDLDVLGFDDLELARQLADEQAAGLTDEDEVPAIPITPVTRPGDLWLLRSGKGRQHRLLCGDATASQDATRLLAKQQPPILIVTDPPYGINLQPEWREQAGLNPRTRQGGKVTNDNRIDWSDAWALFPGDVVYLWHAGVHAGEVVHGLEECGFEIRSQII
jgi:ParB-like chromosome segregation protein Spo0J